MVLTGCGSPHGVPSAAPSTTSTSASSATTTVPGASNLPYNKYKNARLDVTIDGPCTQQAGGAWVLKGTVHNPAPTAPTGFSIAVDYVHAPGGTVLDTQVVEVPPVGPGKTAPWQSSWTYSGSGVTCLVRQAQVT
jgi:hypothetical protein